MSRPASIVQFERLWIAAILLGAVNMAASWGDMLAKYRAAGTFAALGVDPVLGLALIDGLALALQLAILLLVGRAASRAGRMLALLLAGWSIVVMLRTLGQHGAMPGTRGLLATLCIFLQVAGAGMLLRADARAWINGETR